MPISSLLLATAVAIALGGAATAWLWLVQRPRAERAEGFKLLAAMRWREFSRLVVDGLRNRGFEPEAAEDTAERGQDSVIHLKRDNQEWLLACKQGLNYHITRSMVGDVADAVRFHGAAGGVVTTLGELDADARTVAAGQVELYDGSRLWPMVHAQLSPGVQDELSGKAHGAIKRQILIAWSAALTVGLVTAMILPRNESTAEADAPAIASPAPAPSAAQPSKPAAAAPIAPAPVSDDEQRDDVIRMVTTLPGVERAMWSTRSTLLIYLTDENADPLSGICEVMKKYETLRTSRLHLQPPAGAARPARFVQCATY